MKIIEACSAGPLTQVVSKGLFQLTKVTSLDISSKYSPKPTSAPIDGMILIESSEVKPSQVALPLSAIVSLGRSTNIPALADMVFPTESNPKRRLVLRPVEKISPESDTLAETGRTSILRPSDGRKP